MSSAMIRVSALVMAIVAALSIVAAATGIARDLDDPERNAIIFGQPASGRVLVHDLKKACAHLKSSLRRADREQRTLLNTDLEVVQFHTYICTDVCDRVQQNNSVVECRRTIGIKGCVFYGAVYRGDVFQFSIDPAGTVLERDCDLTK